MLIISFDAVGDSQLDEFLKFKNLAAFAKEAAVFREVSSVYLSNTYPVHTSVATGVQPNEHGVTSNTEPFPSRFPVWNSHEKLICAKTLWQAAKEKGIDTAAVLWPVTGYSKSIRYNIPEVLAQPGQSQVLTNLKAGSKFLQLKYFLKYRPKTDLDNLQPGLDDFAVACMTDLMRRKKPGLCMVHLSAYDMLRHKYGKDSDAAEQALHSLDHNLSLLLHAASDRPVLLFSDHSQIDLKKVIDPNELLLKNDLLSRDNQEYRMKENKCYIECCGGSAFFHQGSLSSEVVAHLKQALTHQEGFQRFLTEAEMFVSGHSDELFGFAALPGYSYKAFGTELAADHGYPLDTADYKVFYMARGLGLPGGSLTKGGSLLDIAPLVAKQLGIHLDK